MAVSAQHVALGNLFEDVLLAILVGDHLRDVDFFRLISVMEVQARRMVLRALRAAPLDIDGSDLLGQRSPTLTLPRGPLFLVGLVVPLLVLLLLVVVFECHSLQE